MMTLINIVAAQKRSSVLQKFVMKLVAWVDADWVDEDWVDEDWVEEDWVDDDDRTRASTLRPS